MRHSLLASLPSKSKLERMAQWLITLAVAVLIGGVCALVGGRRGLLLSVGLPYCAAAVWLLVSGPGDLAWPIPLLWVGSVGAAVASITYVVWRRSASP